MSAAFGPNSASGANRFRWRLIALVGYTNAGKSTLFNALTQAAVLESPKMFATLDPTIRGVTLPSRRQVLLSDTVGFIRNLPHTLVSAFRATLEEVQRAALILQVSDASSPLSAEQDAQVEKVLKELEADAKPRLRVMNKIDLLPPRQRDSLRDDCQHSSRFGRERHRHEHASRPDRPDAPGRCPEPRPSTRAAERRKDAGAAGSASAGFIRASTKMDWWSWKWKRRSRW